MPTEIRRLLRRIRLRDLDTLATVVRAGGMRKAALELHMSQPAVSKAIAELEDAVGYSLLDRSRRGVEVTACGQALIRRSSAIFDELRSGVRELEDLADHILYASYNKGIDLPSRSSAPMACAASATPTSS